MTYETYVIISLRKKYEAEIQEISTSDALKDKLSTAYKEYLARSLNPVSERQFNTMMLNSISIL